MSDDMRVGGANTSYVVPSEVNALPKEGTKNVRGTIACDGKGNLVVKNYAKPVDRFCTDVHEDVHRQDWMNRYGPDLCKNVPAGQLPKGGPDYQEFLRTSECRAHAKGMACSDTKVKAIDEKLSAAEEKLKSATGRKEVAAANNEIAALKKDRDALLLSTDNDAANMMIRRCRQ